MSKSLFYSFKLFLGCSIVGFGVIILHHSHLVTGGTAGLSLSLSYMLGIPFSITFFLVNLPFYIFSIKGMGVKFTVSTVFAVSMLSCVTYVDHWLPKFTIYPIVGAVASGIVIGCGLVFLFLNGSSLGGATILAVYCQKKFGFDPGKVNFSFDFVVVCTSIFSVGVINALYSFISILLLGGVISLSKNRISSRNVTTTQKTAA